VQSLNESIHEERRQEGCNYQPTGTVIDFFRRVALTAADGGALVWYLERHGICIIHQKDVGELILPLHCRRCARGRDERKPAIYGSLNRDAGTQPPERTHVSCIIRARIMLPRAS
jgi:hypothetical protein